MKSPVRPPSKLRWSNVPTVWLLASCTCRAPNPEFHDAVSSVPPSAQLPASAVERAVPDRLPRIDADDVGTAVGRKGAVTSAEAEASKIGLSILERGGNAVDAAVAVAFALAVSHPTAGSVGGGGFMVVRAPDGTANVIDYRETAPAEAHPGMYLDAAGQPTVESVLGPRAAGIPGNVAGFALAHAKFGSLPWADLVAPAVVLAQDGVVIDRFHARDVENAARTLREAIAGCEPVGRRKGRSAPKAADRPRLSCVQGSGLHRVLESSLRAFEREPGVAWAEGDTWKQPELAATLRAIQRDPRAFYVGPLAQQMVKEVRTAGGIWQEGDLAGYAPVEREPLRFTYRGHEIIAMPPPSAGGIVLAQVLAASENLRLFETPWDSVRRAHVFAEVLRRAYADRNGLVGDPAFVKVPVARLLDAQYVRARMADIDPTRATPSDRVGAGVALPEESHETTHFSVVDAQRMAVANTFTLNGNFGSKIVVPGTGVILNNEMDDFTAKVGAANMFGLVQGEQNAISPGKRPLSSMTPTIVAKEGELRAVLGSPGGPTITTTVAQVLMQIIDHGRTVSFAVRAPRMHHQWKPDLIHYEPGFDPKIIEGLQALGHETREVPWKVLGHANCIEVDPETGGLRAVADVVRGGGQAAAF